MFKQIYQDLKEELSKNKGIFIKQYEIPSINYNENNNSIKDMYFISGIEMELYSIIEKLENKVFFARYRDSYFFSNDEKLCQELMLNKTTKEIAKDCKNSRINSNEFINKIHKHLDEMEEEEM